MTDSPSSPLELTPKMKTDDAVVIAIASGVLIVCTALYFGFYRLDKTVSRCVRMAALRRP